MITDNKLLPIIIVTLLLASCGGSSGTGTGAGSEGVPKTWLGKEVRIIGTSSTKRPDVAVSIHLSRAYSVDYNQHIEFVINGTRQFTGRLAYRKPPTLRLIYRSLKFKPTLKKGVNYILYCAKGKTSKLSVAEVTLFRGGTSSPSPFLMKSDSNYCEAQIVKY